jgi:hypothetical protein
LTGEAFRKAFKAEIERQFEAEKDIPDDKRLLRYDTKRDAERFIDERLEGLLEMAQAFAALLSAANGKADPLFVKLEAFALLRHARGQLFFRRSRTRDPNVLGLVAQ